MVELTFFFTGLQCNTNINCFSRRDDNFGTKWQNQKPYIYAINRENVKYSFTLIISNRVELRWMKTTNAKNMKKYID